MDTKEKSMSITDIRLAELIGHFECMEGKGGVDTLSALRELAELRSRGRLEDEATNDEHVPPPPPDTHTCDRFKDETGYQGQSHQVFATWPNGERKPLGWQNGTDVTTWEPLAKAWRLTNLEAVEISSPAASKSINADELSAARKL
jgi:hypothetical protein